jgi:hypothetical protein
MRTALALVVAVSVVGCSTGDNPGNSDPSASGKSDTTISIGMCPGAVSTCSDEVIHARQKSCASECASSGHGKSRGIKYCFTANPTGGFPSANGGPSAFCAPCDCADGSEAAPPVNVTQGGGCGAVTYEGYCQDDYVMVYCAGDVVTSLSCPSKTTCQVGVCGNGANCCSPN